MAKKKVTKKTIKKEVKQENELEKAMREGNAVLVVVEKDGFITIHNGKNVGNAVFAKGMLQAALDLYLIRPVLTTVNELHKGITLAMQQMISKK